MLKNLAAGALALLMIGGAAAAADIITVKPGESIQAAVKKAHRGETIRVLPGTYHETVYIDIDDIHLEGVIENGLWPVLDGEGKLNDGILASGHGVTIERMWVRRFKGNGIMTQGSNNFKILYNVVEGPCFYAIFPQYGKNGLVANNTVSKSDDAAIYVGMSDHIDVLNNESSESVIGIEVENSTNALIEGNYVHDNSVGMGTAKLPSLPVKVADHIVIRNNIVVNNNTKNFAPEGAISAAIPSGVGIWILGTDYVTVENNLIRNNKSVGVFYSETTFMITATDTKMNPLASHGVILKNRFLENGKNPDGSVKDILALAGRTTGVDFLTTGKGVDNCIADRQAIASLGANRFIDCAPGSTSANLLTARSTAPAPEPSLSPAAQGRLAYLAVCSGCHTYDSRLIGPPMVAVKAIYGSDAQKLADYIAKPIKKRPDLPEMPPQDYLPEAVRLAVANYVLNELNH
jgi:parallel beta-helix repeat protein